MYDEFTDPYAQEVDDEDLLDTDEAEEEELEDDPIEEEIEPFEPRDR